MSETDPSELADRREREADALARRSDELEAEVRETRSDWEHKRADDAVPGAPPPPRDEVEPQSPAPQSPPPSAGPADAQTAPEESAGPPADVIDGE